MCTKERGTGRERQTETGPEREPGPRSVGQEGEIRAAEVDLEGGRETVILLHAAEKLRHGPLLLESLEGDGRVEAPEPGCAHAREGSGGNTFCPGPVPKDSPPHRVEGEGGSTPGERDTRQQPIIPTLDQIAGSPSLLL